jgi:hypothetical protein
MGNCKSCGGDGEDGSEMKTGVSFGVFNALYFREAKSRLVQATWYAF